MNDATAPGASLWRVRLRAVGRWTERTLAVTGFLFLVYHAFFELSVISSDSMSPTLQGTSPDNGDWVISEKVTGRWREPDRWEVVHFYSSDGLSVMKRVIGLPGEKVGLRRNQIYIDDEPLERPGKFKDLMYYSYGNLGSGRTVDCRDGYYVLGDDSRDSQDSRYVGPVPGKELRGRAWLIIWPLHRAGWVNEGGGTR